MYAHDDREIIWIEKNFSQSKSVLLYTLKFKIHPWNIYFYKKIGVISSCSQGLPLILCPGITVGIYSSGNQIWICCVQDRCITCCLYNLSDLWNNKFCPQKTFCFSGFFFSSVRAQTQSITYARYVCCYWATSLILKMHILAF